MRIELIESKYIFFIIPLINILNPNITQDILNIRLVEMVDQGYKCVGVFSKTNELVGICGLWVVTKYYVGKHIEPDNMVFLPE